MAGLKLSDLKPEDIETPDQNPEAHKSLKLSELKAEDLQAQEELPGDESGHQDMSTGQALGEVVAKGLTGGLTGVAAGLGAAAGTYSGGKKDWASLKAAYQEALKSQNKDEESAKESLPTGVGTGVEIAASLPSLMVGGAALKGAGMASKVAQGATLGGASGLSSYLGQTADPSLAGAAGHTALGAGLGAAGGKLGEKLEGALKPDALEVRASKLASKAVGLKPSKELTSLYNPETKAVEQGADVIKGIGKTALDEGALPMTGGADNIYNKSIDAIETNYKRMNGLLPEVQAKINQNAPDAIAAAGSIKDKAADFMSQFADDLSKNPDQAAIMQKITTKYQPYIDQISQADGDLTQLAQFKRSVQDYATDLAAGAYNNPASDLKPEAEFVKRFGGILRQHIEDLASSVDENAGSQIHDINKTLGNLYTYKDAAKRLMDKSNSSANISTGAATALGFLKGGPLGALAAGVGKVALEKSTGNPIGRLATMAAAKTANLTAKAVQTPAGELAQKAVTNAPLAVAVTNPFLPTQVNEAVTTNETNSDKLKTKVIPKQGTAEASHIAGNLYNATDDSLKGVASTLKKTPGLEFYGDALDKAVNSKDAGEKNRAVFLIMQNPKSRTLVSPDSIVKKNDIKALKKNLNR